jgi:hypothetical protein
VTADQDPLFRVVRGTPTAEELAALVGVIVARSRPTATPAEPATPPWVLMARPGAVGARGLPFRPGPDAWRRWVLPH